MRKIHHKTKSGLPSDVKVWKIQLPLFSNEKEPRALVYDQTRRYTFHIPVSEELVKLCAGQPKVYVQAQGLNLNTQSPTLNIVAKLPAQPW